MTGWIITIIWAGLLILVLMFIKGAHVDDPEVDR